MLLKLAIWRKHIISWKYSMMAEYDKVNMINCHFGQPDMSKLKINNYWITKRSQCNICNAKAEYDNNIILKIRRRYI